MNSIILCKLVFIYFLIVCSGRIDNQVKLNGVRINLDQLQHEISNIALQSRSLVDIVEKEIIVVLEGPENKEINEKIIKGLPNKYQVGVIRNVDKFELTASGKINKIKTLEKVLSKVFKTKHIIGNESIIKLIETTMQKTFEQIDITKSFKNNGITSLVAIELSYKLSQQLGKDIKAEYILSDISIDRLFNFTLQERNPSTSSTYVDLDSAPPMSEDDDIFMEQNSNLNWSRVLKECVDSPALIIDNFVLIGSHGGDFLKLQATSGEVIWNCNVSGRIQFRPLFIETKNLILLTVYNAVEKNQIKAAHKIDLALGSLVVIDFHLGTILQTIDFESEVKCTPTYSSTHRLVFVGDYSSTIHSFFLENDNTLTKQNSIRIKGSCSSVTLTEDNLLTTSLKGELSYFNKNLEVLWIKMLQPMFSKPAVSNDLKNLFISCVDGSFYKIDVNTGKTKHSLSLGSSSFMSPLLFKDCCFVGCNNGKAICINQKTCNILWQTELFSHIYAAPCIIKDLVIYATTSGKISILDVNSGKIKDSFSIEAEIYSSLKQYKNSCVIYGARNNKVYSFQIDKII